MQIILAQYFLLQIISQLYKLQQHQAFLTAQSFINYISMNSKKKKS